MTVINSLDLDEAQYFVGPDLVPNCLQMWLIIKMTTVDSSGKIITRIMTLELLESPRITRNVLHLIYKGKYGSIM